MVQQNLTWRIARVVADQLLTKSSTTLQNVTKLKVNGEASKKYKVRVSLLVEGKADSDIKATVVGPSGATGVIDLLTVNPGVNPIGTAVAVSLADDTVSYIVLEGVVTISTTAGDIQVQAAQNVSQNDQLTILAGSSMEVLEISDTT